MSERLIRLPEVMAYTGLRRSTLYRLVQRGEFPSPVKLGVRMAAWAENEVSGWITSRIERRRKPVGRKEGAQP